MPWVKLDDEYPRHKKLLAAGADGLALDVAGMCWSAEKGTDGFVPDYAITVLYPVRNPRGVASRLEQVGRWERDEERGGWHIHDFLLYNPSAAEAAAMKEARAEAGRRGGQNSRGRQARAPALAEANAEANASASAQASLLEHGAKQNANPLPPNPNTQVKSMLPAGSELFEPWWREFPKRNGRKVGKTDAERVWSRLKPDEVSACLVAVGHYAKACDVGDTLAMDAHRWLTKRRWVDWLEPAKNGTNGTSYAAPATVYR